MTKEFKITITDEEADEVLVPYTNALQRDTFLFELFANFHRKYKYSEDEKLLECSSKILEEIKELANRYGVIRPDL